MSPFSAGNDHLHNFMHASLSKRFRSNLANTLTGLALGISSAIGLGCFFSDMRLTDSVWFTLFLVEAWHF